MHPKDDGIYWSITQENEDGIEERHELPVKKGDVFRFRVELTVFNQKKEEAPMTIMGSICEDGLGNVNWWL